MQELLPVGSAPANRSDKNAGHANSAIFPWRVGDEHIVLDGRQRPVCVIRTVELRPVRFDDIDAAFAREYGEGDM